MEIGRGGARVALQGRIRRSIPRTQYVYWLVWKRRYAGVRAGTQAPPLRFRLGGLQVGGWFRLGRLRVEWVISFGVDCVWVVLFVCWENGAHEPTPSVLYFCQPRVD